MVSALCGWFGVAAPAGEAPEAVLGRMTAGITLAGQPADRVAVTERGALAVIGGDLWHGAGLTAAIHGTPRWTSDELTALAAAEGHARALAAAYRADGENLFERLAGSFALALFDHGANRALLAIDRTGIETLCVAEAGDGTLVFASTTDGVRGHPKVDSTISPQAVYDYLLEYRVPSPVTIYAAQRKLVPGQFLRVALGSAPSESFYWRMPYGDDNTAPPDRLRAELREVLGQAVARAAKGFDGDRVGAFLSGGLDSSTMVGLLARVSDRPVKSFTIGFAVDGYDEMAYADAAVRRFGAEKHAYYVTPEDVFAAVDKIAQAYDEPFGNSSAVPAYLCGRMARESGVDMLIAGDGGDELFAGNERYLFHEMFESYRRLPWVLRRGAIEPVVRYFPGGGSIPLFRKGRNFVARARIPLPDRLSSYGAFWARKPADLLAPDLAPLVDPDATMRAMREIYEHPRDATSLQRMLYLDQRVTLADNDLRKVGRMAELAGISVRYPFLDDAVLTFSARVPSRLLMKGRRLRDFYRRAFADFLPPEVLSKSKHGFALPFEGWLRDHPTMREHAYDCVTALKSRHLVSASLVDRLIGEHRGDGAAHHGGALWDFMMFELWARRHLDATPATNVEAAPVGRRRGQTR